MSQRVDALPCDQVLELIEQWIDGELETGTAAAVEIHLDSCSGCAAEMRLAEEVRTGLHAMPTFEPPQRLLNAVSEATEKTIAARTRSFFGSIAWRPVPALAAVGAVMALLVIQPWQAPTDAGYTELEVARAAAEAKLALAYVGGVSQRAQTEIRERVIEGESVTMTMRRISQSMKWTGGSGPEEPKSDGLPYENSEGSS